MGENCPCCAFLENDLFLPPPDARVVQYSTTNDAGKSDHKEEGGLLSDMLTSHEALQQITGESNERQQVLLVDTHGHPHLNREQNEEYTIDNNTKAPSQPPPVVISMSCAVEEADWDDTLKYASQSETVLPGLGVHPWYLAELSKDWLIRLEELLLKHPHAIVGEIGLCKMARFVRTYADGKTAALSLQRNVFKEQMKLAAKLRRPVSVHCVKQHGAFMSVLKEIIKEATECKNDNIVNAFPTAIGMHSWTGTAHHVKEILKFEEESFPTGTKMFYFGFSHSVNVIMSTSDKSRKQGCDSVHAVPIDRLLVESDVHAESDVHGGTAGAIAYISSALHRPLVEIAEITSSNGLSFLNRVKVANNS